jgi:hypothetical protein
MWYLGLCVQDYRFVSRLCNVDTTAWKADATTGTDLAASMQDQVTSIFDVNGCQPVFYMNRPTFSMFNKQLKKGTVNYLEYIERGGKLVPHFLGIPIRIADAIKTTEDVVS